MGGSAAAVARPLRVTDPRSGEDGASCWRGLQPAPGARLCRGKGPAAAASLGMSGWHRFIVVVLVLVLVLAKKRGEFEDEGEHDDEDERERRRRLGPLHLF